MTAGYKKSDYIYMKDWTKWKPMPSPDNCRKIEGPKGPGVYQIKNKKTNQLIQFGIGIECQKRMKSFFRKKKQRG
jgi:hypothetical protein